MPFESIEDARDALRLHALKFDDDELDELQGVSGTIRELAAAHSDGEGHGGDVHPAAYVYLARKLMAAVDAIDEWNSRAHALTVIVAENDVAALDRFEHLKEHLEELDEDDEDDEAVDTAA